MGESMSVFIRRFVKLKCSYKDLHILTISKLKIIIFFVSILFRNLVRSIHLTTCRSMFSEAKCAHMLLEVVKIGGIPALYIWSPEQFEKNDVFVGGLWAFRHHWQKWKTNGTGSGFRRWTRTEYHFDTDVESLMSRGLQLKKNTKNYQWKNQWKGEGNWAWRWTSDPSSRNLV